MKESLVAYCFINLFGLKHDAHADSYVKKYDFEAVP